jgi:photosystem II stability/assembly factor-like uncharacterized protein
VQGATTADSYRHEAAKRRDVRLCLVNIEWSDRLRAPAPPPGEADGPRGCGVDAASAVAALYQSHALGLVRLAYVMLGNRASAEDVVQEAFYGLYRRWDRLSDTGNPHPGRPRPAPAHTRAGGPLLSFRVVGPGPQTTNLQCLTRSICYSAAFSSPRGVVERTSDGGVIWQQTAPLPDVSSVSSESTWLSCPAIEVCVAIAGQLRLAVTTDAGARWTVESLATLPGMSGGTIDAVSCATARSCVVHAHRPGASVFANTTDGGRTWTMASPVPQGPSPGLWYLRCDPDGRCVGAVPTGSNTSGEIWTLRSGDSGHTWAVSSTHAPPTDNFAMSCGDALHCMEVTDNGGVTLATSNGGDTWRSRASPRDWPDTVTSMSCPAAGVCLIALADMVTSGWKHPVIEATHDDGRTWTALSLPRVNGAPLAIVSSLSCPGVDGCVAVAALPRQHALGKDARTTVIMSSFPV